MAEINMDQPANLDILEKTLERMLHWIAAADNKVAPVLAIDTTMLGVIAAIAPKPGHWSLSAAICAVLTLVLVFASLALLFLASFPRTSGPKGSLVFFGGITERERALYVAELMDLSVEKYRQDLAVQCYRFLG
jgi:hypothetical protein